MAAAKSQSLKNARYEVLIGSKFEGPLDELQLKALWRSEKISADSETRPWGSARSFVPLSRFFDWAVADELRNVKKRSNFARNTRSKFARIAEELAGDTDTRSHQPSVAKINVQRRATVDDATWASPSRVFIGILMAGFLVDGVMSLGRTGGRDFTFSYAVNGANTGGYIAAAFLCALFSGWKWPIFFRILIVHVVTACLFGYYSFGMLGLSRALGYSLASGLVIASLSWFMLGRDWIVGKVIFWSMAGLFIISIILWFLFK